MRERGEGGGGRGERGVHVGYMKMWVDGKIRKWDEIGDKWCERPGND